MSQSSTLVLAAAVPDELWAILRLVNFLKDIYDRSQSCAALNRHPQHPTAPYFLEFTFTLIRDQDFDSVPTGSQGYQTIQATVQFVLLGSSEQDLADYITGTGSASDNIASRVLFLLWIRTWVIRILYQLAYAEQAIPESALVRAHNGQWIIRPSQMRSVWDELPPLPRNDEDDQLFLPPV